MTTCTLEQEPGRRPDLPVTAKETLPLNSGERHKACQITRIRCHQRAVIAELHRNERHRLRRGRRFYAVFVRRGVMRQVCGLSAPAIVG